MKLHEIELTGRQEAALTILPGLLLLLANLFYEVEFLFFLWLAGGLILLLAGIVKAAGRRSAAALPVWSLIPLGYLLLALTGLISINVPMAKLIILAGIAAVGLFYARHLGLRAVLLVLPALAFMIDFEVEAVIYFWEAPRVSLLLRLSPPLIFFILTPLALLRIQRAAGQAAAVLFFTLLYYLLLWLSLGLYSPVGGMDWAQAAAIARPVLVSGAVLAVILSIYSPLRSRFFYRVFRRLGL